MGPGPLIEENIGARPFAQENLRKRSPPRVERWAILLRVGSNHHASGNSEVGKYNPNKWQGKYKPTKLDGEVRISQEAGVGVGGWGVGRWVGGGVSIR